MEFVDTDRLSKLFQKSAQLQELEVSDIKPLRRLFRQNWFKYVTDVLTKFSPLLQKLSLQNFGCRGDEGMHILEALLGTQSTLSTLKDCNFNDNELWFSEIQYRDRNTGLLCDIIRSCQTLKKLSLSTNAFREHQTTQIMCALTESNSLSTLVELHLRANHFDRSAAEPLAIIIEQAPHLKEIDISGQRGD